MFNLVLKVVAISIYCYEVKCKILTQKQDYLHLCELTKMKAIITRILQDYQWSVEKP